MRLFQVVISSLALGLVGVPALAQDDPPPPPGEGGPPGGGAGGRPREGRPPQITKEQLQAAWELQAKHVSKTAGLNDGEASQVVTAYKSARENLNKAMQDMREKARQEREAGNGGGNQGTGGQGNPPERPNMMEEMQKVTKGERDKFEKSLNGFLKADQTAKVIDPLGGFPMQWDPMTNAIIGFKLDDAKQSQAMDATIAYNEAVAKARQNGDRDAQREANQAARAKLTDTMKGILTEEQLTKFQRTIGGRGAGPAGEGAPRRRPPAGGGGEGGAGGSGAGGAGGGEGGAGGSGHGGAGGGGGRGG